MKQHLSSTPSTPSAEGPTVPAAYRIYEEDRSDFEDGVGSAFWIILAATLSIVCLLGWVAYLSMTSFGFGVLCGALAVGALWGLVEVYRAYAAVLDRDDRKDRGII